MQRLKPIVAGEKTYWIDAVPAAHDEAVDLRVYDNEAREAPIAEIHWQPGALAFHVDESHKQELKTLFRQLTFSHATGQVFGCPACGAPVVVPFSPKVGTMTCPNDHRSTYHLVP